MCKINIIFIISISGFLLAFSVVTDAHASCSAPLPIGDEFQNYANADTVFVGMVVDIYNPSLKDGSEIRGYDTITFDVKRLIKGQIDDGKVRDPHNSIGFRSFEMGETYLVYAFGGINEVSQCTSPILLDDSFEIVWYDIAHHLPFVVVFAAGGVFATVVMIRRMK